MNAARKSVLSMTGFCSIEKQVGKARLRIEIKALNHRFLDVKLRLPREFSAAEIPLRLAIQTQVTRGALEVKVDRVADTGDLPSNGEHFPPPLQLNLGLAAHYYESLITLQKTLGISDPIRTIDIANFPEVVTRTTVESTAEHAWANLEPLVIEALGKLIEMRAHEGRALTGAFQDSIQEMRHSLARLRKRREQGQDKYRARIQEKIQGVFEAYPLAQGSVQSALESRISQELALILERTDVEEELVRFESHLDHFSRTLEEGGSVGRKLDFILQEMNREMNTLGTKAQDDQISQEVIQIKLRVEQLREQAMNLE